MERPSSFNAARSRTTPRRHYIPAVVPIAAHPPPLLAAAPAYLLPTSLRCLRSLLFTLFVCRQPPHGSRVHRQDAFGALIVGHGLTQQTGPTPPPACPALPGTPA